MKVFSSDRFVLPLPDGHRFPMQKYRLLRERIEAELGFEVLTPPAALDEQLLTTHSGDYLTHLKAGTLERQQVRRLGFPYSPALVERSRRSVGATLAACRVALSEGVAANLAGGTHHAFADRGEGFCVFNDSVVALRALGVERAIVIDCDVHQGNGTAALVCGDQRIFSFSMHGARNFPFRKETSDCDVALEDGTADSEYLEKLQQHLEPALDDYRPSLAIYLSGADPFIGDRLGRLSLTKSGLEQRDRLVFRLLAGRGIPVAVTMGGGYANRVEDIVDIHATTIFCAREEISKVALSGRLDC